MSDIKNTTKIQEEFQMEEKKTIVNKFPIKTALLPVIAGKFKVQYKGVKSNRYLILNTGEIYQDIPPLGSIVKPLRNGSEYNLLYAEFLPEGVGPENKSGIIFRHMQILCHPINRMSNNDKRDWFEHNRSKWYPFIISSDGKIYAEDGITPKFSDGEGKYYNKSVVTLLTSLHTNNLHQTDPIGAQMKNFLVKIGLDFYPNVPLVWAWTIAEALKKIKPRGSKTRVKEIDYIKNKKWENPFTLRMYEQLKKYNKVSTVIRCWIADPIEDTKDTLILHLMEFNDPGSIKEIGRFYHRKNNPPIILIKRGTVWEQVRMAAYFTKIYYPIIPDYKFKNTLGTLIAQYNNIYDALKIYKNKEYKTLIEEERYHTLYALYRINHNFKVGVKHISFESSAKALGDKITRETIEKCLAQISKTIKANYDSYSWLLLDTQVMEDLLYFYYDELVSNQKIPVEKIMEFLAKFIPFTKKRFLTIFYNPWGREGGESYRKGKMILSAFIRLYFKNKKNTSKILEEMKVFLILLNNVWAVKGVENFTFEMPKTFEDLQHLNAEMRKTFKFKDVLK